MKLNKFLYVILAFFALALTSCDPEEVESNKTKLELISQNSWKLDRFTTEEGQMLQNNELNQTAVLLFIMDFEFLNTGEVRGVDKSSNTIIDRGVWEFVNNETAVQVNLSTLDYEFQVLELKPGKLTLQAPTGNFLSGVGERVNLEFIASN